MNSIPVMSISETAKSVKVSLNRLAYCSNPVVDTPRFHQALVKAGRIQPDDSLHVCRVGGIMRNQPEVLEEWAAEFDRRRDLDLSIRLEADGIVPLYKWIFKGRAIGHLDSSMARRIRHSEWKYLGTIIAGSFYPDDSHTAYAVHALLACGPEKRIAQEQYCDIAF
ncbi:MAG: hypothetical protein PHF70_08310 [Opitutales bacterium]|nr:hypothetical protein [Opitutales bacterium]